MYVCNLIAQCRIKGGASGGVLRMLQHPGYSWNRPTATKWTKIFFLTAIFIAHKRHAMLPRDAFLRAQTAWKCSAPPKKDPTDSSLKSPQWIREKSKCSGAMMWHYNSNREGNGMKGKEMNGREARNLSSCSWDARELIAVVVVCL